jgi:polygalacturonase
MNAFRLFSPLWFCAVLAFGQSMPVVHNVVDFGATGDGTTVNTLAIQRAVDRCVERGGAVLFPPGRYVTGSKELRSNVEILLQNGASILGSADLADYAEHIPAFASYNDLFLKHSLF